MTKERIVSCVSLPPSTDETVTQEALGTEDARGTHDPARVTLSPADRRGHNHPEFIRGFEGRNSHGLKTRSEADQRGLTPEFVNEIRWSRLMAGAQKGDRASYDCLLREIVPFVTAILSRAHRSQDRIDEVIQDVLLTVHRVRHTYDPSRPFKPWLASIAHRRSIDLLRRRSRRAAFETSDAATRETPADLQVNNTIEIYASIECLNEAIAGLPQQQRQAVELLKLCELSLAEASQVSGKSVAALKVNVHRAIKSLRLQMKRSHGFGRRATLP
jgi:RNA polymerase sigma-70 factor (ECF subfamily)